MSPYLCSLFIVGLIGSTWSTEIRPVSTLPPDSESRCEPIDGVLICLSMDWQNASFPNYREHQTQPDANAEVIDFYQVIRTCCSPAIVHFLCAYYTPACVMQPSGQIVTVPPCRGLCQMVRDGCEHVYQSSSLQWPSHLDCDRFPVSGLCLNPPVEERVIPPEVYNVIPQISCSSPGSVTATVSPASTVNIAPSGTVPVAPVTTNRVDATDGGLMRPTVTPLPITCQFPLGKSHPLFNRSYSFGSVENCGIPCQGIYFSEIERNTVAPIFILLCAVICIGFTLFTVGTFLIDRKRFHYPERPVIFLALCYLTLSVAFIVGAIVKLANPQQVSFACSDLPESTPFVFQNLPGATPTYHSASCVILFIFVYYFQMAGAIWWVILALTWCLASSLKWGEEAIERPWILYHSVAWSLPAIQSIIILIVNFVDGDQLSGICYPGNYNTISLGVFVFFPLAFYLLLGVVFLSIGFISLIHIRIQIRRDSVKSNRLQRLIIRIFVYSLLYVVPSFVFLCLVLYEIVNRSSWELAYNLEPGCRGEVGPCSNQPTFIAFLLRYLMLFIIGIFSTFWVISWKTFLAWKKFFSSVFCCHRDTLYVEPNKRGTKV